MGACFFKTRMSGKSARDAYDKACKYAEDEYGHQEGYNGTISTTSGFRDKTNEYRASKLELHQFIEKLADGMGKRDCACICIREPKENKNKTKSQVEHIVTPGTKKWVLKYAVHSIDGVISKHDTKGDAVKAARTYTEKYLSSTNIYMEKTLEKGTAQVAKVIYKRSSDERDGEWVFFGYAAE